MTPFFSSWDQLTQNRHVKKVVGTNITALYSALSIAYFFTQILVLISVLDANRSAGRSLESFLNKGHVSTSNDFAHLDSFNGGVRLQICDGISKASQIGQCPVVFPVENMRTPIRASEANSVISQYVKRGDDDLTLVPVFDEDSNLTGFMILDAARPGEVISIPPVCLQALEWPYQRLIQNRRVDVTVACFQVFLLVVSVIAVFKQSFSCVAASLVMHTLAFILSAAQISEMLAFQSDYARLVTSNTGACDGYDMLASFFSTRLTYAIAITVVNIVALAGSTYLTWRLSAPYGVETLRNAEPRQKVRAAWLMAQALFSATQLAAFFFVASVGIWLDEISKHIMGARPAFLPMTLAFYIISVILAVPWLALAHIAILRESARVMVAFFAVSFIYIVGCGVMFVSTTFRQTFVNWPFFAAMFALSYIFVAATVILAVLCRLNFGTEVMQYLRSDKAEEAGSAYADEKGNLKRLTLAHRGQPFLVALPRQNHVENPPKRWASLSSTTSSKSSYSNGSGKGHASRMPIIAAQPGAIRIASPMPTATPTTLSPANSVGPKSKSAWRYGERPFWGKSNKRHESAMSFGHMDPSRLTLSIPARKLSRNLSVQPSTNKSSTAPGPRVDSVGSIYSTQFKKTRLVLVTDL